MGFLDRFRPKEKPSPEFDPLRDLVLDKLRVGYLLDYDLETWVVTAYQHYRFNDGRKAEEWELSAGREKRYLERAEGDGLSWSFGQNVPIGALGDVRQHIERHEDPPEQIVYQDTSYNLLGSVGGYLRDEGESSEQEMILWEFADDDEERFLSIMQWSETELSAAISHVVEDYQFTNILPGGSE
jgi:hypothetical protein